MMTNWQWRVILALIRAILTIIDGDKTGIDFDEDDIIILREAEMRNRR
jgi:hypothetical protein